jgi:hypothetical protein
MGNVFEVKDGSNYPFAVKANGTLIARKAEIRGGSISIKDSDNNTLFDANSDGVTVNGNITATSGKIGSWNISTSDEQSLFKTKKIDNNDCTIRLGGTTYGINVNGKFKVDYSGNMTATSGTFSGDLNGAGGTFKGKLQAASGSFSGDVTANSYKMDGDNFTVYDIPIITKVTADGTMYATRYRVVCAGAAGEQF